MSREILFVGRKTSYLQSVIDKLERDDWKVFRAPSNKRAVQLSRDMTFCSAVVDGDSPRVNVPVVVRSIRKNQPALPVIVLLPSGKDSTPNVCDVEFVRRPIPREKLIKLIKELSDRKVKAGPFTLYTASLRLECPRGTFVMRPTEARLLRYFMEHPNETLTREELLEHVWGTSQLTGSRTLYVHISWLRRKLERDPAHPSVLRTVRGVGYRFVPTGKPQD